MDHEQEDRDKEASLVHMTRSSSRLAQEGFLSGTVKTGPTPFVFSSPPAERPRESGPPTKSTRKRLFGADRRRGVLLKTKSDAVPFMSPLTEKELRDARRSREGSSGVPFHLRRKPSQKSSKHPKDKSEHS